MVKKEKKKKKSKRSEEEVKAEEDAQAKAEAEEKLRIRRKQEEDKRILDSALASARKAMRKAADREMVLDADDRVTPVDLWRAFEATKAAKWRGTKAGVNAQADEFAALRRRADTEKAMLAKKFGDKWHEERLEALSTERCPGTRGGPKVPGNLADDEQVLEELWHGNGGEDGSWDRVRGWDNVGKWMELCEAFKPKVQVNLQPPLKPRERNQAASVEERIKESVPLLEGVVVHRGRVQNVHLFANGLEGALPRSLGQLTHLKILSLHGNSLTGAIPKSLTECQLLSHLDLSRNDLSGNLPAGLSSLKRLKKLHLEHNSIGGPLPTSMSQLALLEEFTAHRNELKGPLPADLGECRFLVKLSLHHNQLTGFLPESLTQCKRLNQLLLVRNKLLGDAVPSSVFRECSIESTPRSGRMLKCQVFPSIVTVQADHSNQEPGQGEDGRSKHLRSGGGDKSSRFNTPTVGSRGPSRLGTAAHGSGGEWGGNEGGLFDNVDEEAEGGGAGEWGGYEGEAGGKGGEGREEWNGGGFDGGWDNAQEGWAQGDGAGGGYGADGQGGGGGGALVVAGEGGGNDYDVGEWGAEEVWDSGGDDTTGLVVDGGYSGGAEQGDAAAAVGAEGIETTGYYDDNGYWLEGYYDGDGNWVESTPSSSSAAALGGGVSGDYAGGGAAAEYDLENEYVSYGEGEGVGEDEDGSGYEYGGGGGVGSGVIDEWGTVEVVDDGAWDAKETGDAGAGDY